MVGTEWPAQTSEREWRWGASTEPRPSRSDGQDSHQDERAFLLFPTGPPSLAQVHPAEPFGNKRADAYRYCWASCLRAASEVPGQTHGIQTTSGCPQQPVGTLGMSTLVSTISNRHTRGGKEGECLSVVCSSSGCEVLGLWKIGLQSDLHGNRGGTPASSGKHVLWGRGWGEEGGTVLLEVPSEWVCPVEKGRGRHGLRGSSSPGKGSRWGSTGNEQ